METVRYGYTFEGREYQQSATNSFSTLSIDFPSLLGMPTLWNAFENPTDYRKFAGLAEGMKTNCYVNPRDESQASLEPAPTFGQVMELIQLIYSICPEHLIAVIGACAGLWLSGWQRKAKAS